MARAMTHIEDELRRNEAERLSEEWSRAIMGELEVDPEETANLVHLVYKRTGVKKPPVVIHCASPLAGLIVLGVLRGGISITQWEQILCGRLAPRETTYDGATIAQGVRLNLQVALNEGVVISGLPRPVSPLKIRTMHNNINTTDLSTFVNPSGASRERVRNNVWGRAAILGTINRSGWVDIQRNVADTSENVANNTKIMGPWETLLDAQVGEIGERANDAHWASWAEFLLNVPSAWSMAARLRAQWTPQIALCKSSFYWIPYTGVCIVVANPVKVRVDDQRRLHCDFEPAVKFADGWSLYSWHGVNVPSAWIMKDRPHGLDAGKALQLVNIEERRAACEILGWDVILKQLNARVIDKDDNPQIGTLLEVFIPGVTQGGAERFLRVKCGTGRTFALPVPPQMRTAREANAWTYGLAANDYNPEVRT